MIALRPCPKVLFLDFGFVGLLAGGPFCPWSERFAGRGLIPRWLFFKVIIIKSFYRLRFSVFQKSACNFLPVYARHH
jgi:hypothetical protein